MFAIDGVKLPRNARKARSGTRVEFERQAAKLESAVSSMIERSPAERHRAMTWAQRLKWVFRIDIEQCERCVGKLRIVASIEDSVVIGRFLAHLTQREQARGSSADLTAAHRPRGSPGAGVLELS